MNKPKDLTLSKQLKPQMDTDRHRSEEVAKKPGVIQGVKASLQKNLCSSVSICGFCSFLKIQLQNSGLIDCQLAANLIRKPGSFFCGKGVNMHRQPNQTTVKENSSGNIIQFFVRRRGIICALMVILFCCFLEIPAALAQTPPSITAQPQSLVATNGTDVSLSVTVAGDSPFAYQWHKNGANIAAATNATLTLTNIQPAQSGNYDVVVTNLYGAATS